MSPALRRVHHEQPPVGQEVDAHGKRRHADHDLMATIAIERNHLMRAPVGKPDSPVVPTRRLTERDPFHYHSHVDTDRPEGQDSSIAAGDRWRVLAEPPPKLECRLVRGSINETPRARFPLVFLFTNWGQSQPVAQKQ